MHIFKRDIGKAVTFAGFDLKHYNGVITDYRKGVAKVEYPVRQSDGTLYVCVAYLDRIHHNRIQAI